MDKISINTELVRIAFDNSEAFCYGCYIKIPRAGDDPTRCPQCGSDDLMSVCDGEGPEWGVTHVIEHLLIVNCEEVSESALLDRVQEMLDECYPEIEICGITYNQGEAFKRLDSVAFERAASEYVDQEIGETIITFDSGSTYFDLRSVEDFISKH